MGTTVSTKPLNGSRISVTNDAPYPPIRRSESESDQMVRHFRSIFTTTFLICM
jgi:hypothetical protein